MVDRQNLLTMDCRLWTNFQGTDFMTTRRMLTVSLLVSLLGYLIVFTIFSVPVFKEIKRPREITRVSFVGKFAEKNPSPRMQAVVGERKMPQLQPLIRDLDVGPGLILGKPLPMPSVPRIFPAGIFSILKKEEATLLEVKISAKMKKSLPEKLHLLEREQEK